VNGFLQILKLPTRAIAWLSSLLVFGPTDYDLTGIPMVKLCRVLTNFASLPGYSKPTTRWPIGLERSSRHGLIQDCAGFPMAGMLAPISMAHAPSGR